MTAFVLANSFLYGYKPHEEVQSVWEVKARFFKNLYHKHCTSRKSGGLNVHQLIKKQQFPKTNTHSLQKAIKAISSGYRPRDRRLQTQHYGYYLGAADRFPFWKNYRLNIGKQGKAGRGLCICWSFHSAEDQTIQAEIQLKCFRNCTLT